MPVNPVSVVVLAAGQGKRMRSDIPKVLHPIAGRSMLARVLDTASALSPQAIYGVYGHAGEAVRSACAEHAVSWVHQAEQLGTGHAVAQALPAIPDDHQVLVLCGDVPLIRADTLKALIAQANGAVGVLTVELETPTGYGRILRNADGAVVGVVEEKDASPAQRQITEVNAGLMCLPAGHLRAWLSELDTGNAQGEYYLTDCISQAHAQGVPVQTYACPDLWEVQGVNDRVQLAAVERACQRRQAHALMRDQGLALADPDRFDLRGSLQVGRDCFIDVNVVIEGDVVLGDNVHIGAFTQIRDTHVAAGTQVLSHCRIEDTHIGEGCQVGPFARLRPGTALAKGARVGNFVEIKHSQIGVGSKINHLTYIGDATVGASVNVGAGTITCNYDGTSKHHTNIGDGVFIGSNSALVAPLDIGNGVTIGAGTTVRDDIAADCLAVDDRRPRQVSGWRRPGESVVDRHNSDDDSTAKGGR